MTVEPGEEGRAVIRHMGRAEFSEIANPVPKVNGHDQPSWRGVKQSGDIGSSSATLAAHRQRLQRAAGIFTVRPWISAFFCTTAGFKAISK
jgi:hypothetical protein